MFFSLSLGTQVFILIRIYLILFNLSYDNLDYSLSATSSNNVMSISNILTTESSSVGNTSTGGKNPPPTGNTGDGVSIVLIELIIFNELLLYLYFFILINILSFFL
jgi:hypothetical protein